MTQALAVLALPAALVTLAVHTPRTATLPTTRVPGPGPIPTVSAANASAMAPLRPQQINTQLELMRSSGVTLVRDDLSWGSVEPQPPGRGGPEFHFGGSDLFVAALALHHLALEPILDYSVPWAASVRGDWRSPPADDAQFAAYARAVAARYGAGGSFWRRYPQLPYEPVRFYEVWNEENGDYWDTGWQPGRYAGLYLAARGAIRAVQPTAQVIVGGLSMADHAADFVRQMFRARPAIRGNVDGFGLHPYAPNDIALELGVRYFRATLDALGDADVPIDITEFGWETGSSITETWRARMMGNVAAALTHSTCGVRILAPYDWINPRGAPDGDYGLSSSAGLRPAGKAWFVGLKSGGAGAASLCATRTGG